MLDIYKTVKQYGQAEVIIKRSRFIGHAMPVASEDEAIQFIGQIKQQHKTATHNCYGYITGERDQYQKQSDDGEPSGTAGKPILEVIKHRGLQNIAIVVTRYFGGTMLGAGGLIRAYSDGAVIGIDAAVMIEQVLHQQIFVEVDYTWLGKIEHELRNEQVMTGETQFSDKVILCCLPLFSKAEAFVDWILNEAQGQAGITFGDAIYVEHAIGTYSE